MTAARTAAVSSNRTPARRGRSGGCASGRAVLGCIEAALAVIAPGAGPHLVGPPATSHVTTRPARVSLADEPVA